VDRVGDEGRQAIQAFLEAQDKSFPNGRAETSRLIEDGDTVVAEHLWQGTNTGPLVMPDGTETPATGKTVEMPAVSVITVKEGKVARQRDYADMAAMMSQLGPMPGS
jgi:predicted ester cyclase